MKPFALPMALLLGLATAIAPATSAGTPPCDPGAVPTPIGDFGYHVSDGGLTQGYLLSGWIYAESNGMAGLQRGGVAMLTGEADPCQGPDEPDTLLSGVAVQIGDPPALAPYPGWIAIIAGDLVPTTLYNPLGFDCGAFTPTASGGSVTCHAPAAVPPGFVAGCRDVRVYAGFAALPTPGLGITGSTTCAGGTASATCTSAPGTFGATGCAAGSPGSLGALPVTCAATLAAGSYQYWAAICLF